MLVFFAPGEGTDGPAFMKIRTTRLPARLVVGYGEDVANLTENSVGPVPTGQFHLYPSRPVETGPTLLIKSSY